jgi:hypothetical protein
MRLQIGQESKKEGQVKKESQSQKEIGADSRPD